MDKKKEKLKAATNLMAVLPPSQIRSNIIGVMALAPALQESIMEKVDMPHVLQLDIDANQKYIRTEMNKMGESYRSPYSNQYFPQLQSARQPYYPSSALRDFEDKANQLFEQYTRLYYDNGVGSFYVRENEDGLACGYFAKKECLNDQGVSGCWDTSNTIDIKIDFSNATKAENSKKAIYKLSTTVLLELVVLDPEYGEIKVSGQLKKNKQQTHRLVEQRFIDEFHLTNIGRMVEDMETNLRQQLESVQIGKLRSIIQGCRYQNTRAVESSRLNLASQIHKNRPNFQQLQEKDCVVLK